MLLRLQLSQIATLKYCFNQIKYLTQTRMGKRCLDFPRLSELTFQYVIAKWVKRK